MAEKQDQAQPNLGLMLTALMQDPAIVASFKTWLQSSAEEVGERRAKAKKVLETMRRARESKISQAAKDKINKEIRQRKCNHMKINGKEHALVGQQMISGNLVLACQWCQKQFSWEEVPDYIKRIVDPEDLGQLFDTILT